MDAVKYLLIGGGLASHRAAQAIRGEDPDGSILIVGKERHLPYNRPPLTKSFMQGKTRLEQAFLVEPTFYARKGIDVTLGTSVQSLDLPGKSAWLSDGQELRFDKAFIGTGGSPRQLDIPGTRLPGVFYFRTVDDAEAVSLEIGEGKRVAIVGGGFISMELAGSLTQRGCHVELIHPGPHVWSRFMDGEIADFYADHCRSRGVTFHPNQRVTQIEGRQSVQAVLTSASRQIDCDMVILAVGIEPNVQLARESGLAVDNGIIVNEFLQTSHPDVYAGGDNANFPDPYFHKRRRVEHWGQADYCGDLAGRNMTGARERYALLSYIFSDVFDLHLEMAGDETKRDRMLLRGRLDDEKFTAIYLAAGRATAYFSVNDDANTYKALNKIIENKIDLTQHESELTDGAFDLTSLVPKEAQTT